MARLVTYTDGTGKVVATTPYPNVKLAVFAGYRSGRDFHVIEDDGAPLALFWTGRWRDTNRDGFPWAIRRELRKRAKPVPSNA